MNKYSISFKYLDFNSKGRKYIYADSEDEAFKLFKKKYEDYNIEILGIKKLEENLKNFENILQGKEVK